MRAGTALGLHRVAALDAPERAGPTDTPPANANRCAKANREVEFDQTVPGLRGHTDMLWSEIGDLRAFRFDAELLKALAEQHRDAINGTRSARRPAER